MISLSLRRVDAGDSRKMTRFYIINKKVWQNGYARRMILWDSGEPIPSGHFVGVAIPAATEFCLRHDSPVTRL